MLCARRKVCRSEKQKEGGLLFASVDRTDFEPNPKQTREFSRRCLAASLGTDRDRVKLSNERMEKVEF